MSAEEARKAEEQEGSSQESRSPSAELQLHLLPSAKRFLYEDRQLLDTPDACLRQGELHFYFGGEGAQGVAEQSAVAYFHSTFGVRVGEDAEGVEDSDAVGIGDEGGFHHGVPEECQTFHGGTQRNCFERLAAAEEKGGGSKPEEQDEVLCVPHVWAICVVFLCGLDHDVCS